MTGPSVVAVARIGLELARRTWPLALRALTAEDRNLNPADLLCCVMVFGHGAGVPAGIERVSEALEDAMPALLRRHVAVRAAPSSDPAADVAGTLYIDCLFRPGSPRSELTDELYAWALSVAIPAAIRRGSGSRVTWAPDDAIAARVVTAGIPPAGSGVQ